MTEPRPHGPSCPLDDPSHWSELVESVGVDSVLVVLHRKMGPLLRSRMEPEDLWQMTLEHAWRDRAKYHGDSPSAFRAWLLGIAYHRINDELDRAKAKKRVGDSKAVQFSQIEAAAGTGTASQYLPGISTTPDRLAYYKERAQVMRDALGALDEELEPILRGYLFEKDPMPKVAEALGIPLSTAWNRFRKASELYAKRLQELMTISGIDKKPKPT